MEKNERLAWRTKPRTYCFSSCPKRHCKRETLPNCKLKKNNFSGPEKLFFHFPFQTLLGAGTKLFRCLFQLPRAPLQRETLPNCKLKKQLFRPRKVVFSFSLPDTLGSRHEAFQVPFPAAQSATAKGDPSNCKLKNNFSGSEKLFFPKVWALDMLYSHPQAQKKTTFRAPKSCFFQKRFWAPEMLYPSHMPARLGQKSWYISFLRQKGSPTGSKKKQLFGARKVVFSKSGFERPTCFILATCPLD